MIELKTPAHHWIEDGTDEDFRRNILEADELFYTLTASGTYVIPDGAPMWRSIQGIIQVDFTTVEPTLLQRLMNRPEMKLCESQGTPQIA